MGRKSTKTNKNIYHESRENVNLSRETAAELMDFVSVDRIEKIEHDKVTPMPSEVLAMAECYKNPRLCNYYCSHECPIGQEYVPAIETKGLSQITLEMIATLNSLTKTKERLVEITVDGKISADEMPDFLAIKEQLANLSFVFDTLTLWVDNAIANGEIDKKLLDK